MVYELYQVRLTENDSLLINSVGWDKAQELSSKIKAYATTFMGKNIEKAWATGEYEKVAEIEATDLENAFDVGNIGPETQIKRYLSMRSMSVGDVLKDTEGKFYAVEPIGFKEIK